MILLNIVLLTLNFTFKNFNRPQIIAFTLLVFHFIGLVICIDIVAKISVNILEDNAKK